MAPELRQDKLELPTAENSVRKPGRKLQELVAVSMEKTKSITQDISFLRADSTARTVTLHIYFVTNNLLTPNLYTVCCGYAGDKHTRS